MIYYLKHWISFRCAECFHSFGLIFKRSKDLRRRTLTSARKLHNCYSCVCVIRRANSSVYRDNDPEPNALGPPFSLSLSLSPFLILSNFASSLLLEPAELLSLHFPLRSTSSSCRNQQEMNNQYYRALQRWFGRRLKKKKYFPFRPRWIRSSTFGLYFLNRHA